MCDELPHRSDITDYWTVEHHHGDRWYGTDATQYDYPGAKRAANMIMTIRPSSRVRLVNYKIRREITYEYLLDERPAPRNGPSPG